MKTFIFLVMLLTCSCTTFLKAQQNSYLVKDIKPGKLGSGITNMIQSRGILYFLADDGDSGYQLWRSDGTEAGTLRITNLPNRFFQSLVDVQGTIFFTIWTYSGKTVLYKTNGTEAGTTIVKEWNSTKMLTNLVNVNGLLLFTLPDTEYFGVWRSDGTESGTYFLKNVNLQTNTPLFLHIDGTLFFSVNTYSTYELWKTNGTKDGTLLVKNALPAQIRFMLDIGNTLYFTTDATPVTGSLLWKSNGTTNGTVKAAEFPVSTVHWLVATPAGQIYCIAQSKTQSGIFELWKSNGTQGGTTRIRDFGNSSFQYGVSKLKTVNEMLFFTAGTDESAEELWKSDGTVVGTELVSDIYFNYASSPTHLTEINGTLFFLTSHPGKAMNEIWRSDGTAAGTRRVDSNGNIHHGLFHVGGHLFFVSNDVNTTTNTTGQELWAVEVSKITGVNENGNENTITSNSLHIYPNPLENSATISVQGDILPDTEYILFDVLGREVRRFKNELSHFSFDRSSLNAGMYTLQLSNKSGTIHQRLVIIN